MGIFDIFRKKTEKNKYQIFYEAISEILKVLARKKGLVQNLKNGSSFVDLNFEAIMFEQIQIVEIIKSGSISFLGQELINEVLEITNNQEINKDEIENIWNYLINEQEKLKKLF